MLRIQKNKTLVSLNSFHLDIRAKSYVECRTVSELSELIAGPFLADGKYLVLGEGSNILFTGDYPGLVLRPLMAGREIVSEDRQFVYVRSGAGENWDKLVEWAVEWGFGGIENLSLIPGSVGSAPIQNIGAYGCEIRDVISQVDAIDTANGSRLQFKNEGCRFGYRDSIFKREWKGKCIITSITCRLTKKPVLNLSYAPVAEKMAREPKQDLRTVRKVIIDIRRSKLPDPEKLGNTGSFFQNPVISNDEFLLLQKEFEDIPSWPVAGGLKKIPAAWLIENSGWKGERLGNVGSFEKQPLVLVNYGGATGKEILELADKITESIQSTFGIRLEKEVNII